MSHRADIPSAVPRRRPSEVKRKRGTRAHKKAMRNKRAAFPICQRCSFYCATETHHVVPMAAGAIRSVATPRDDLREIARFARIEKQFGMEVAKVPWQRRLAGPNDVLISWGGQIRFVTIGDEVGVL